MIETSERPAARPGNHGQNAILISHLTVQDDWGRPALDDVSLTLPAGGRIAFLGGTASGADEAAMAIAGLLAPERGRIDLPAEVTAGDIGYIGPNGHVFAGSIGHNLFYGSDGGMLGPDDDLIDRGLEALAVAGLGDDVYRFGLRGTVDPTSDPDLAEALLAARRRFRRRIEDTAGPAGAPALVEFFDAGRYNSNATLAENLLFGVATDETFAVENLADQPYVRQILDEAGLAEPLLDMGYIIASTMVEMFAGLPPGHPFFEQFSFISSADLPYFQSLTERVERHAVATLGEVDRARLLGLPFKLIPARHRLGVLNEDTERRILFARRLFAAGLPDDLRSRIAFFDPERATAAASLADNILFGKVAHGAAGAARQVDQLLGEIVEDLGLGRRITAAGLDFDVGVGGARLTGMQRQKLALARGLVRAPSVLVLVNATAGLDAASEAKVFDYLFSAGTGPRTLIWSLHQPVSAGRFDHVVRFADGHVAGEGVTEGGGAALDHGTCGIESDRRNGTMTVSQGAAAENLNEEVAVLGRVPLFHSIDPAKLKLLAFTSDRVRFAPDDADFPGRRARRCGLCDSVRHRRDLCRGRYGSSGKSPRPEPMRWSARSRSCATCRAPPPSRRSPSSAPTPHQGDVPPDGARISRHGDRDHAPSRPAAGGDHRPAAPRRYLTGAGFRQRSTVTDTGTWSEGRSQPRASLSTSSVLNFGARSGVAQTWSSRRPRLDASQSFAR